MSTMFDYVDAVDNYHQLLDKYFRITRALNGGSQIPGAPLTSLARKELREAYNKVNEAKQKMGV